MTPRTLLLPLLLSLIVVLGLGCKEDRSRPGASDRETPDVSGIADPPPPVDALLPGESADSTLPVLDFPLLDEVRSLDMIELQLRFSDSLKKLDGQRVQLVGFMAPFDNLNDMRRCMIVPSYVGCKFCDPPSITQVVYVTQGREDDPGRTYPFIEEASRITGTFRLSLPGTDHEGEQQGFVYSIEDAVVTVHKGKAPERAASHGNKPHKLKAPRIEPVATEDLIREVAGIIGRDPLVPIEVESVPAESFAELVRARLEARYPEATREARTTAFRRLGLFPDGADWIDSLAEFELSRRVTWTDETGGRLYLLDSVPENDPYVRLERVGAITDALTRQHFPSSWKKPGDDEAKTGAVASDDLQRAQEAVREGFRSMVTRRYARAHGIPYGAGPPIQFVHQSMVRRRGNNALRQAFESDELRLWQAMPRHIGSFFVDYLVGDTGPLADVDPALTRPPTTTMEFFRPRWYEDAGLWKQDPVPVDFADSLRNRRPVLTDVLGIGGLVPFLSRWYPVDVAKLLLGRWAGDRFAVWEAPEGGEAVFILEIRWQDEESAVQFREAIPDGSSWRLGPHKAGSKHVRLIFAP